MSAFPILRTGAVLQYPATKTVHLSTCVLRFLDGAEQRFREYPEPIRKWIIRLDRLEDEELANVENFCVAQQGKTGTFSFTDPWDGEMYPSCSIDNDTLALGFQGLSRGQTVLVVRQNRS